MIKHLHNGNTTGIYIGVTEFGVTLGFIKTLVRTVRTQMSFPETVSDSFRQKFFGCANQLLHQLSRWLVSDDLAGEEAVCGCRGLVWSHVVCGSKAGRMYYQISGNNIGDGLWW